MLHDGLKCGMWEDKTAFNHPLLISDFIKDISVKQNYQNKKMIDEICFCIESHMGKWNTNENYDFVLPLPMTGLQQMVHLCDYLASRKNLEYKFDIEGSVD